MPEPEVYYKKLPKRIKGIYDNKNNEPVIMYYVITSAKKIK